MKLIVKCKGIKTINNGVYSIVPCNKCQCTEKLDWIEAIVGKKKKINLIDTWSEKAAIKIVAEIDGEILRKIKLEGLK